MTPLMRRLAFWSLVVAFPACNGGGCSGCSGVTPLPDGFARQERIENSASVRLTSAGIGFLQQNLPSIATNALGGGNSIFMAPISTSNGEIGTPFPLPDIDYTICPAGPVVNPPTCQVEVDMAGLNLALQPSGPSDVVVSGTIPVRMRRLPINTSIATLDANISGNRACPDAVLTFKDVGVNVRVRAEIDPNEAHARWGYTKLSIADLQINKQDIVDGLALDCNGGVIDVLINFFRSFVVDQAFAAVQTRIRTAIAEQFCQKPVANACPSGTNPSGGICLYPDGACVGTVLGTDGHAELSGLLASISPGTKGALNFMLAVGGHNTRTDGSGRWGDLNPIGGGATLGMYGGVEPAPISKCITPSTLPRPEGIPIPDELGVDFAPPAWPGPTAPHAGVALSESFMNYALSGLYNSGVFCIGITTETIELLNSGTLALLAPSLKDLTLHQESAAVGIVVRPTQAPSVVFGNGTDIVNDPHIRLKLTEAEFDLYVFSLDRFIRFMTLTFDIEVPINLGSTPEGLVPFVKDIGVTNGKIANATLLRDDVDTVLIALQGLVSSQVGALLAGGINPIDLAGATESLGIRLVIPESPMEGVGSPGIVKLSKDSQNFLGVFGTFATTNLTSIQVDTNASIENKVVEIEGLREKTITDFNIPTVSIRVSDKNRAAATEYQVRVDKGLWKPFTRGPVLTVQDPAFRLEGRHLVEVRGRVPGDPMSLDGTPERLEVLIDRVAPEVSVSAPDEYNRVAVSIRDGISKDATEIRYRFDEGKFSEWISSADLKSILIDDAADEVTVEARDEEGNIASVSQPLLRGLDHSNGSCGCRIGENERSTSWHPALGLLLGLGMIGWRRGRRQRIAAR